MTWVLRDSARFLHERDEIEKLLKDSSWLKGAIWRVDQGLTVQVDLDLEVYGTTYAVTLTYPDLFPETPAYIRPRDSNELWSGHQYGRGGVLCLEWRADNWESCITGADLIRSAYKLLATEQHPEQPAEVASVHELTIGQELRTSENRFVTTGEFVSLVNSSAIPITRRLRTSTIFHNRIAVGFVSRFEQDDSMKEISDLPKGISSRSPLFAWRREGNLFKHELFDQPRCIGSMDELRNAIQAAGFVDHVGLIQEPGDRFVLLVGTRPESLRVFGLSNDETPSFNEYAVLAPEQAIQRLPPEHEHLRGVRVGVVGLGSLGSKIAISLGRSGVRRFLLIDDDIFMPGNVCRHELSWESVGVHKVQAISEALTLIAPSMDVDVRVHRIAGQESAMAAATALKDLASCDLLIDATANPQVFLRLAAIARVSRRPMCWGEVFAGGFGGLIARARPDLDPHPAAVRAAILRYFETLPSAPYKTAEDYNLVGSETAIAYDAEIEQIAAAVTRLALDVLLKQNPGIFPYSAYLIGLRKGWVFLEPFDTQPIEVTGEGWGSNNPNCLEEDRREAIKILLSILTGEQNGEADSAA